MHTHMSLFEGDSNAFYDAGGQYQLSKIGRQFVAGLLRARARDHRGHEPVRQLVQAPVGRRRGAELRHLGPQQPLARSCACRCTSRTRARARASSTARIDSAANPYLAFSLLLAAGLKGIEEGYELPPEAEDNVWELTDAERRALGYDPLPASLDHALSAHGGVASSSPRPSASRSSTTCCSTSVASGASYRSQVTPFELESNLEIL